MSDLKVAKLLKVDGDANNNKFYHLSEQSDGSLLAEYGRVEGGRQRKTYKMSDWDRIYKSKTSKAKGYKDVTKLFSDVVVEEKDLFEISNAEVKRIMQILDKYSKDSVKQNYSISSHAVTEIMVDEAQVIINDLLSLAVIGTKKDKFNEKLVELFHIIPRKMGRVKDYLLEKNIDSDDNLEIAKKMIASEQDVLDPMHTQVQMNATVKKEEGEEIEKIDILKVMGIEMSPVTETAEINKIKKLMGPEKNLFRSAFKVTNHKTQAKYDKHLDNAKDKTVELFWHGSRNPNWSSILTSGLMIRPSGAIHTGSMFGDGIYAADKFKKSLGYSSLSGSHWTGGNSSKAFLSLFSFHVGKQKHITNHDHSCYSLSKKVLDKKGYDSVFAHGGADLRNNEYIVYDSNQVTVEYIIEIER